ncbi:unnamed protein product, partial [Amoebophrya sp. A25]
YRALLRLARRSDRWYPGRFVVSTDTLVQPPEQEHQRETREYLMRGVVPVSKQVLARRRLHKDR